MSRELDQVALLELLHLLELATNLHELVLIAALGSRGTRPHSDAIKRLAHVDDNAHHLVGLVALERLADRGKHHVKPQIVNVDGALVLELVRPLASVLVLGVFPLWADALLEEVVVGLERELRGLGDVVLGVVCKLWDSSGGAGETYIDAPELLNRVKGDDLLQQFTPVVAALLQPVSMAIHDGACFRIVDEPFRSGAW